MNINLQQAKSLLKNNKVIAYIEKDGIPFYTDIQEFVPFNDMVFKSICLDLLHTNNVLLTYNDNITYGELSTINNNDLLDNVILSEDWENVTSLKDLKFFTGFTTLKNLSDDNEIFTNIGEIDMRNISSVGSYTFLNHTGINLYNTYNITVINAHAFDSAIILNNTLSFNSLIAIGQYAFYNAQFNSIIHLGTATLAEHCFENAIFTNISFNSNNTTVGNYCFKGATIGHLTGENNITAIGNNAFENVDTTMYLHLSGLTSLGNNVFKASNISTITSLGSITAIGEYTFNNCTNLTNLDFIPNTVLSIGTHAFDGCSNIKKIELPLSVTSIASYAISNCTKLRNIKSLGSITAFTASMIDTCPNLEIVYFPDTIENWDVVAFNNCINLKIFANIKNYTYLDHCFSNCPKLDTIWFSDTLAEIKVNGILVCDNQFIKTIKLGSYLDPSTGLNITDYEITKETITVDNEELEINHYPFEQLTLLEIINVNNNTIGILNGVNYMGKFNDILNNIPNPIALLHVSCGGPSPVTSTNVHTVTFSSIKDDQYAFNYSESIRNNNLQNIILEDNENVKLLKYYSYYYPTTDTSLYIKIGKYVETIEMGSSFNATTSNTYANTITVDFSNADSLKTIQYSGMSFSCSGYLTLNMPVLPPNVEIYSSGVFMGAGTSYPLRICNDLVFPNTVKEITLSSFNSIDCNNNSITIPPSADVSIYYSAFCGLQNFKKLNICNYPNHKTRYIYDSFNGIGDINGNLHFDNFYITKNTNICNSFATTNSNVYKFTIDNLIFDKDYDIPYNVPIFALPPTVTNLYLPDNSERYRQIYCEPINLYNVDGSINGEGLYHNMKTTTIKNIEYKSNTTHINKFYSSYFLTNLEKITMPNTVEFIGPFSYQDTDALKEFNMPENIKYIGQSAFYNSKIYNINLLNVHWIGSYAFQFCNNLESITIPASVVDYPNKSDLNYNDLYGNIYGAPYNCYYSFMKCNNLKHVTLPNNMTSLPIGIFLDCKKLYDINLDNIKTLGDYSLQNTSVNIDLENTQITSIGAYALYEVINTFKHTLILSDTITEIGYAGLGTQYNEKIYEIVLPLNLHRLNGEVFANHKNLSTINVENIEYFDVSCLANTNISEIGIDSSYVFDLSDTSIKYIGNHIITSTPLYQHMKKFDISNTKCPDTSSYTLKDICKYRYSHNVSTNAYAIEIDLSNSGVNNIETSAFLLQFDTYGANAKTVKLDWKNQNDYINLQERCIFNNYYTGNQSLTLIVNIDVLNSSLGEMSLKKMYSNNTVVNYTNLPTGDIVYINPSTNFNVMYPTVTEGYPIGTLKFGPAVNNNTNFSESNIITDTCRCLDMSESGKTQVKYQEYRNKSCRFEEVILGNNITTIGTAAFEACASLKRVNLGTGVTSIGFYAFINDPVEVLICRATTPPTLESGNNNYKLGLYDTNLLKEGAGIYVPDESVAAYKTAWQNCSIGPNGTYTADHFIKPLSELPVIGVDYIQSGLVLHLDGINKGSSNSWIDSVSNREFIEHGNVTKDSSSYIFDGSNDTYLQYDISNFPEFSIDESTVEVCYKLAADDIIYYIFGSGIRNSFNPLIYVNSKFVTWNEDGHIYCNYRENSDSVLFHSDNPITLSINGDRGIINGEVKGEISQETTDFWDLNNNERFRIGSATTGGAAQKPFNGHIYSIRFYNRKLTQAEQLHNQQVDNIRFNLGLTIGG